MDKHVSICVLYKILLSVCLGFVLGLLLCIELVTFPVVILNKKIVIWIMNRYNRLFTKLCVYIVRVGNSNAVQIVNKKNNPIAADPTNSGSCMLISNHICAFDTVLVSMVSNYLGKNTRFIAKDGLKWFPVLGWGMYLSDYLFIKRVWHIDLERIRKWCTAQTTAISLIIYPEGTRYTKKKTDKSVKYSVRNKLPVFTNVLYPRTKGYKLCMETLPNPPFATILNVTILYVVNGKYEEPPSFWACLLKRVPGVFKVIVEKEEITGALKEEAYLIEKFQEKDRLIGTYKY